MRDATIFDLDGTLCDVASVRFHVSRRNKNRNFEKFHQEATGCPPHGWVAEAARTAHGDGQAVLVVTARSSQWMNHSTWWLLLNDIPFDQMYMRRHGDWRKDYEVKRDILGMIYRDGYHPVMAWDDNPAVIGLWQEYDIPTTLVPGWQTEGI